MGFWRKVFFHSPAHYAAALLLNVGLALIVLFARGFGLRIYYIDAFSVAGAVSALLGLLLWAASAGAFDTFGYGFSFFGGRKHRDLYEYTVQKREKRSRQNKIFVPYIAVGLAFLAISFLIAAV